MQNILLLEDDTTLGSGICLALQSPDLQIQLCRTLAEARALITRSAFDLLILDVNLPDGSGLELLRELRECSSTPIILLTANDMELDIVTGLEMGADDYITKPFSLAVLRARVNARLRQNTPKTVYKTGPFTFDFHRMDYRKEGMEIDLSKTEQKLLRMLVEHRGQTLSRAVLVDRIWSDSGDYVDENALSVTVKRLRDKLEATPSKPRYLKTVYGVGYVWEDKE